MGVEIKGVDFGCERALRAWCLRLGLRNNFGVGFDGVFETAQRYYEFVTNSGIANKNNDNSRIVNININLDGD